MSADDGIVQLINEAYLKATDVRTEGREALESDLAWAFFKEGLGMLCDLARAEDKGIKRLHQTLASLERGALVWLAADAVAELAKAGWRVPRMTCPKCGSEAIDPSGPADDSWVCIDCDYEWRDAL